MSAASRLARPADSSTAAIGGRLSRRALRLLEALRSPGTSTRPDPGREDLVFVSARAGGVSLGRGSHPAAALQELADGDLVEAPEPGRFAISQVGRAHLRRHAARAPEERFEAQHREVVRAEIGGEAGIETVRLNAQESPLDWLRRRRDGAGQPLIGPDAYAAGERLRRDMTLAGMMPSVTARWEGAIASGGGALRDPASATDAMIAARQRVRRALDGLGSDFADLLIDLCGFLKGLEQIERDRRWPPRSGKVVVRLALDQLARQYGLSAEARGPSSSRGIRSWAGEGDAAPAS